MSGEQAPAAWAILQDVIAWITWALPVIGWLGSSIIGGVVTHFFAQKKHRSEQIWNKKLEAYSIITAAIDSACRHAENMAEAYQENPHSAYSSEWVTAEGDKLREQYKIIRETTARNRLVLSSGAAAALDELASAVALDPNSLPDEAAKVQMNAFNAARRILLEEGKRDLER